MKGKLIHFAMMLGTAAFISACSDGHSFSVAERISTPNVQGAHSVKRISYTGYYDEVYNWSFTYSNGVMTTATSRQSIANNQEVGYTLTPQLVYRLGYGSSDVSVNVTSSAGNDKVKLTLTNFLVASAVSGNTTYHYSYADGRLAAWNVTYENSGFAGQPAKGSSASISWTTDGNIEEIRYVPSTDANHKYYTYRFEYSTARNVNGLLPEKISRAFGCESFEYLYYAGLLGRGTTNLPSSLTITYSMDEEQTETYEFFYNPTDGSDVKICQYGDPGQMVNVEYGY